MHSCSRAKASGLGWAMDKFPSAGEGERKPNGCGEVEEGMRLGVACCGLDPWGRIYSIYAGGTLHSRLQRLASVDIPQLRLHGRAVSRGGQLLELRVELFLRTLRLGVLNRQLRVQRCSRKRSTPGR